MGKVLSLRASVCKVLSQRIIRRNDSLSVTGEVGIRSGAEGATALVNSQAKGTAALIKLWRDLEMIEAPKG